MINEEKPAFRIPITVDDRERASGTVEALERTGRFKVIVERLTVGDYQINNRFLVERKTFPDFIHSVKSGRLFNQVARLAKKRSVRPLLILEGTGRDLQNSRMSWEAIQGALITVSVFYGVPLLRSRCLQETVKTLIYLVNQERIFKTGIIYRHAARPNGKAALQRNILQSLPGIGAKRADSLLACFDSVKSVITADENTLAKVPGIGLDTARKIHWSIRDETKTQYAC